MKKYPFPKNSMLSEREILLLQEAARFIRKEAAISSQDSRSLSLIVRKLGAALQEGRGRGNVYARRWLIGILGALMTCAISGCGKASAGGTATAVRISDPPAPGITCFAIQNEQGATVGGSCIAGSY